MTFLAGPEREPRIGSAALPPGWAAATADRDPHVVPDPAEVAVPEDLRAEVEEIIARYPDRHSAALPALGAAQRRYGWCSPQALVEVACVMQVTPAYLAAVATFYDMLRTQPSGRRYVYVCTSVSCHLRNARAVYEALVEAAREQGLEDCEIREFECLGACDMAPMASIDGRYVGPLSTSDAAAIVAALRNGETPLPGRALGDSDYQLPWQRGEEHPLPAERVRPHVHPAGGVAGEVPE